MATADVFCLPSYREGFGTVIIEAAACGTPSIGSNIYGISDAILDKETGLLTWELDLQPGESQSFTLSYSVQYPKGSRLNLE